MKILQVSPIYPRLPSKCACAVSHFHSASLRGSSVGRTWCTGVLALSYRTACCKLASWGNRCWDKVRSAKSLLGSYSCENKYEAGFEVGAIRPWRSLDKASDSSMENSRAKFTHYGGILYWVEMGRPCTAVLLSHCLGVNLRRARLCLKSGQTLKTVTVGAVSCPHSWGVSSGRWVLS